MNSSAFLFDVDGVLSDPASRQVTRPEIFVHLISKLQNNTPVGIISGRGMIWLRSRILKIFEKYIGDHPTLDMTILDNLYISAEFGGIEAKYSNGQRDESINTEVVIPKELWSALEIIGHQFSDYAFIDSEKQTQFTLEANMDYTDNFIPEHGTEVAEALTKVVSRYPDFVVLQDRFSVNVRHKNASKKSATVQYLKLLSQAGTNPSMFYVFGDSLSDLEMGEALHEMNKQFEFIFTGDQNEINSAAYPFKIFVTKGMCDAGTLEYLDNLDPSITSS